jgi:hydrogenase nickel incorporation protein HypA/HybF
MHEMTMLSSVTQIIAEEMEKNGLVRLERVTLKSGALAGLVPEAMRFAWEVLTDSGPLKGAELCVETVPVRLRCGDCLHEFAPKEQAVFAACPFCGQELGHKVMAGREVYIESIEGEDGANGFGASVSEAAA